MFQCHVFRAYELLHGINRTNHTHRQKADVVLYLGKLSKIIHGLVVVELWWLRPYARLEYFPPTSTTLCRLLIAFERYVNSVHGTLHQLLQEPTRESCS